MAARMLSRDELAFGRAVLLATDSLGMSAEGAFWIYDDTEDTWHFFLVTSLFNRIGPKEIFLRLNKALEKKLSEHEIYDFSLFIADPNESFVKSIYDQVQTTRYASEPQETSVRPNGKWTKTFVYRMSNRLNDDEAKLVRRRFNRLYRELVPA